MTLVVEGRGAGAFEAEAGGHRIQRVPRTDKRARVQSSTVTVHVSRRGEGVAAPAFDPRDVRVEWFSGTGCGGQHRNRHMNSARAIHVPTGIVRTAQTRSRESSLREAMAALERDVGRMALAGALAGANGTRRDAIGTGERSDKRRTYRFRDDVVKDHATGREARASEVMEGRFDALWR